MIHENGGKAVHVAGGTALASFMGIQETWPLLLVGILLGTLGKAAAILSTGRSYNRRDFWMDVCMAGVLFFLAAFVVEGWTTFARSAPTPVAVVLIAIMAGLSGDKVRPMLVRAFLHRAGGMLGLPDGEREVRKEQGPPYLGVPGSTAEVSLPPATVSAEIVATVAKLSKDHHDD